MGASNVAAALVVGKRLAPGPKLILVRMALVSLDADRPPRYFAGWELLAETLGRDVPPADPDDKAVTARRQSHKREVLRHVKVLRAERLIEACGKARAGRNAEYLLHLSREAAQTTLRVADQTTLRVVGEGTEGWSLSPPLGVGGATTGASTGTTSDEVVTSGSVARASHSDVDSQISTPHCPYGRLLPSSSDDTTCICAMCRMDAALREMTA